MSKAGTLSASKVFYFPNKQSQKFQPTTSGYKALQNTQGASGNSQRGTPIKIENGKSEYRGTYFFFRYKKNSPLLESHTLDSKTQNLEEVLETMMQKKPSEYTDEEKRIMEKIRGRNLA